MERLEELRFAGLRIVSSTSEFGFIAAETIAEGIDEGSENSENSEDDEYALVLTGVARYDEALAGYAQLAGDGGPGKVELVKRITAAGQLLVSTSLQIIDLKNQGVSGREILDVKEEFEEYEEAFLEAVTAAITREEEDAATGVAEIQGAIRTAKVGLVVLGFALSALTVGMGMYFARRMSGRVQRLGKLANEVSQGKLDVVFDDASEGGDELSQLGWDIEHMVHALNRSLGESRRLAQAMSTIGEGVCITDSLGHVEFANAALETMLGFAPGEIHGHPLADMRPGGDDNAALGTMLAAMQTQDLWTGEADLLAKGGWSVWTHETTTILRTPDQESAGFVCVHVDITERKRADDELRRHALGMSTLVEMAGILAAPAGFDDKATRILDPIARSLEAPWVSLRFIDEQEEGLRLVASIKPDRDPIGPRPFIAFAEGQIPDELIVTGRLVLVDESKSTSLERMRSRGIRSRAIQPVMAGGRPMGVLTLGADSPAHFTEERCHLLSMIAEGLGPLLTEARLTRDLAEELEQRQIAEKALGNRSHELDALFKINRHLVGPGSYAERVQAVLYVMADAVGATTGRVWIVDKESNTLAPVARTGAPGVGGRVDSSFPEESFYTETTKARGSTTRGGEPASGLAVPLKTQAGTYGVVTLGADTEDYFSTETVILVESMVEAMGALVETQQMRTEVEVQLALAARRDGFIATASHELRTPLTALLALSELLLLREPELEVRRSWYETINRESRRLTDILSEMLDVTRIQSGEMTINMSTVDLREIVNDVVSPLAAAASSHDVQVEMPELLPQIVVDRGKMAQVLMNLVSNAIKYSPQGGQVFIRAQPNRGRPRNNALRAGPRDRH